MFEQTQRWNESKHCLPAVSQTPLFKGAWLSQHLSLNVMFTRLVGPSKVVLLTLWQYVWMIFSSVSFFPPNFINVNTEILKSHLLMFSMISYYAYKNSNFTYMWNGCVLFFSPLFVLIIVTVISLFHCLHLLSARLLKLVHVLQPFKFCFFYVVACVGVSPNLWMLHVGGCATKKKSVSLLNYRVERCGSS